MATVKVLRPFNNTASGDLKDVGDKIENVSDTRALELKALGLAEPVKGSSAPEKRAVKAAPKLENKAATTPDNKDEGVRAAARVEQGARRSVALERK